VQTAAADNVPVGLDTLRLFVLHCRQLLHFAVQAGSARCFSFLADALQQSTHADFIRALATGEPVSRIWGAPGYGGVEVARALLAAANTQRTPPGSSALCAALFFGSVHMVRMLLDADVDITTHAGLSCNRSCTLPCYATKQLHCA